MTAEQVRKAREANPFRPFTIRLADGRAFPIHHRDFISISPVGRIIIVYDSDGSASILDLNLVAELQVPAPSE
jgi:hypothetical protein